MIELTTKDGVFVVTTKTYTLFFPTDRPFVFLDTPNGVRLAELYVPSSIHPINGRDDTTTLGTWSIERQTDSELILALRAGSSVWKSKTFFIRCQPHRFSYTMEVEGTGKLAEVNYLGGYCSAAPAWGSGFFWSAGNWKRGFNPEPNTDELNYFSPSANSVIDLTGVNLPGRGDWFFTPPPFCFAFEHDHGWLGLGITAQPGANRFIEYSYHGQFGFHLSLSYEGHTSVNGRYCLPPLTFDFGVDEFEVLAAHVRSSLPATAESEISRPDWWYEPIFCGWGAQCHLAATNGGIEPQYSTQSAYEGFLKTLDSHAIAPGVVVLDDKWQSSYGENRVDEDKWPDLPCFIKGQHERGRRVLLWLKAWDPEGLPLEECITNAAGLPLAADPTHPRFAARLCASVRNMISKDGYDADGFKIDFTARIPSGPCIRTHGDAWGLELMKLYLGLIYREAKTVKPDALIMTHTPHPYLSDVLDMIRLNDMLDLGRLDEQRLGNDLERLMSLRARVARIACPNALIDTDNWPVRNKSSWRDYIRMQPELGVPSLYFTTHIDLTGEELTEEDYSLVRETWERYRASIKEPSVLPVNAVECNTSLFPMHSKIIAGGLHDAHVTAQQTASGSRAHN